MSYDNTNSGFLASNDRKEKDTHPTHKGSINIEGKEYWVSAWVNDGKAGTKLEGKKYFSLKLQPKEDQADTGSKPATPAASVPMDDDIPF